MTITDAGLLAAAAKLGDNIYWGLFAAGLMRALFNK